MFTKRTNVTFLFCFCSQRPTPFQKGVKTNLSMFSHPESISVANDMFINVKQRVFYTWHHV